jgi:group I intron endonuclease
MRAFCIYLITNLVNGKIYVGKSNDPQVRWRDHKKIATGGKDKYPTEFFAVHAALHKYGIDKFKFEIIEEFDSEDESYKAETRWIEFYQSDNKNNGYNCNKGGKGGIIPNEETRRKLIAAQNKPERKKLSSDNMKARHQDDPGFLGKINTGNQYTKGRLLSQEEKDHLSEIFAGRIISDETKIKMSEAQTGSKHSQAKFTEEEVLIIREEFSKIASGKKKFCEAMGIRFNVGFKTIENIVYKRSWRHI